MAYPQVTPASGNTPPRVNPAGPNANQGVGAGSSGQAPGSIPPANAEGLAAVSYSAAVLDSIPTGDSEDSTVMCLEVASHLQDVCQKLYSGQVQCDDAQRQTALAEKLAQLKDALDKLAQVQNDHHSFWDILGDIFGAIASILAIVVGAVLCVVPGGQVLGALCIAGGCIGMTMVANSITAQTTGHGFMGLIVKACGGSDEDAAKADMAFGITMAVLELACCIACIFVAAPQAANSVAQGAEAAAEAERTAETLRTLQTLKTASSVVSASTTVVSEGGQISVAVIDYSNAGKQADAKKDQARAAELSAWVTEIDHFIDVALKNMKANADVWASTVRNAADTLSYENEVALLAGGRIAA